MLARRPKSAQALAMRARIVLAWWNGCLQRLRNDASDAEAIRPCEHWKRPCWII